MDYGVYVLLDAVELSPHFQQWRRIKRDYSSKGTFSAMKPDVFTTCTLSESGPGFSSK